jgi:hypothetical protein
MTSSINISSRVLEETPGRAVPFLRAITTKVSIRSIMMGAGYTDLEQARGWKLVLVSSGYVDPAPSRTDDQETRAAIAEIDAWDEQGFRRARAALDRLHPEQSAFVFHNLGPAQGAAAIVSVATLLDRLDALESAPDRAATRDADHAALATLEQRGIGKAERARLRRLLAIAQSMKEPVVPELVPSAAERDAALRELRAWYVDWSETARAVIRRRDHLILMGLAHRKYRDTEEEDDAVFDEEPEPATETSPPTGEAVDIAS